MKTLRIAVTCGRDHKLTEREELVFRALLLDWSIDFLPQHTAIIVRHGNARVGDKEIDRLVESWCSRAFVTDPIDAPWGPLKKLLGEADPRWKAAGPIRNWQLLQGAEKLVAFPGGKGTADCVRQARELGVEVVEIQQEATR